MDGRGCNSSSNVDGKLQAKMKVVRINQLLSKVTGMDVEEMIAPKQEMLNSFVVVALVVMWKLHWLHRSLIWKRGII